MKTTGVPLRINVDLFLNDIDSSNDVNVSRASIKMGCYRLSIPSSEIVTFLRRKNR